MKKNSNVSHLISFIRGINAVDDKLSIKTLLLLFAACAVITGARAQCTVVNVPSGTTSSTLWTDTGITLTTGDNIRINANGLWSGSEGTFPVRKPPLVGFTSGRFDFTPQDSFLLADGLDIVSSGGDTFFGNGTQYSLIAYVGSDPEQGQWHTTFFPQIAGYWGVGSSFKFTSSTNGKLWLGLNDDAVSGPPDDNAGSQMVQIFLNNATNNLTTNFAPVLCEGAFAANTFSFSATNGAPFSLWAVYDSCDKTNWVFIGPLALDSAGSNRFSNVAAVPERYYKLDNGICHSVAYGFSNDPVWTEINFQFPASTGQATKTGVAAVGSSGDYWNRADVLDGEEHRMDGDAGDLFEQVFCSDKFHLPTRVTVGLHSQGDPPMGFACGAASGSYVAATDPLMLGVDLDGSGDPMAVSISGLDPHGTYDIYLYGLAQTSGGRWKSEFELLTSATPDVTTSSSNPQSTDSGTSWNINTWDEGKQYVKFSVSFTSPDSGYARNIRFMISGNGNFPLINGLQIVRTDL